MKKGKDNNKTQDQKTSETRENFANPLARMSVDDFDAFQDGPMSRNSIISSVRLGQTDFLGPLRAYLYANSVSNPIISPLKGNYNYKGFFYPESISVYLEKGLKSINKDIYYDNSKLLEYIIKALVFAKLGIGAIIAIPSALVINTLYNIPDLVRCGFDLANKKICDYAKDKWFLTKVLVGLFISTPLILGSLAINVYNAGLRVGTNLIFALTNLQYGFGYAWEKSSWLKNTINTFEKTLGAVKGLFSSKESKDHSKEEKSSNNLDASSTFKNLSSTEKDLENSKSHEARLESDSSVNQQKEINVSFESAKSAEKSVSAPVAKQDEVDVGNIAKASHHDKQRLGDKFIAGMKKGKS